MSKHISSLKPSLVAATRAAKVSVSDLKGRISLRLRDGFDKVDAALGITLPRQIGTCSNSNGIEAVCLGPDEWTLVMDQDRLAGVQDALAALYATLPHAMTEITGREVTFAIDGPQAAELMTIGCPRDIRTIKPGQARRTLFDGVTVVIWRDAADSFRMDVWNSFAPFVAHTLETGCKELAAEAA